MCSLPTTMACGPLRSRSQGGRPEPTTAEQIVIERCLEILDRVPGRRHGEWDIEERPDRCSDHIWIHHVGNGVGDDHRSSGTVGRAQNGAQVPGFLDRFDDQYQRRFAKDQVCEANPGATAVATMPSRP